MNPDSKPVRVSEIFNAGTTPRPSQYKCGPRLQHTLSPRSMSRLIDENLEFYSKINELEKLLQSEHEEKGKLQKKLQNQEETIKALVDRTSLTSGDEFEMAAEILELKRQLAKERKLNDRINREVERQNIETKLGLPSLAELREKELIQRVKDAQESIEQSHKDAEMATIRVLSVEEERGKLIADIEKLRDEMKALRVTAGEGEKMKGINEGLEIQLKEARKSMKEQLMMLEHLRKENFELLRRPSPVVLDAVTNNENLERSLQLQLRRQIDRLQGEKKELKEKLKEHEGRVTDSIEHERETMQHKLDKSIKEIEDASHQLVLKKCEVEKLTIDNQNLGSQLEIVKETLAVETMKWTQRIEESEQKAAAAEELRDAAEESLKCQSSTKNEIIDKLYKSNATVESLENENRQLKTLVESLNGKIDAQHQLGLQLRSELEEKLKLEISQLQQQLKAVESANERLKGELELKEYLVEEEQAVAQQTKARLDVSQQRLEESETNLTQQSRLISEQAERLSKSDALCKQRDSDIHKLNKTMETLESMIDNLKTKLRTATAHNERLSQMYEGLECRYTLSVDDHRRVLSDAAFYRQELERFADYQTSENSSTAATGKAREKRLNSVFDGIKRQILAATEELKLIGLAVNEQIKRLPIVKPEKSDEFEVVHIVEHFRGEKHKALDELRAMTMRLSETECAYQSLLEKHQALKKSHALTLKDLLDLKVLGPAASTKNAPMIDACVGTSEADLNCCSRLPLPSTAGWKQITSVSIELRPKQISADDNFPFPPKETPINQKLPFPHQHLPLLPTTSTRSSDDLIDEFWSAATELHEDSLQLQPSLNPSLQSIDSQSHQGHQNTSTVVIDQQGTKALTTSQCVHNKRALNQMPENRRSIRDFPLLSTPSTVKHRIAQFDKQRNAAATAQPPISSGSSVPRETRSDSPRISSTGRVSTIGRFGSSGAAIGTSMSQSAETIVGQPEHAIAAASHAATASPHALSQTNEILRTSTKRSGSCSRDNDDGQRRPAATSIGSSQRSSGSKSANEMKLGKQDKAVVGVAAAAAVGTKRKVSRPASQTRSTSRSGKKIVINSHYFE